MDFNEWLGELPHKTKIVIEGNHEHNAPWKNEAHELLSNGTFLRNEPYTTDDGVKIFGKGFFWCMKTPNPYDDLIPSDTDILVSHNPARGYVDGGHGCLTTREVVAMLHPRLYVCGHVHIARGLVQGTGKCASTLFVNGANVLGDHNLKEASYKISGGPTVVSI